MIVIKKPWGQEEVIEINERYMVKRLTMMKGHRCSLQFHNQKQETVYLLSGSLKIYTGTAPHGLSERVYNAHDSITLKPGTIHRMEAIEDSIYLEASTPEMDDVVRLTDDYNRLTVK